MLLQYSTTTVKWLLLFILSLFSLESGYNSGLLMFLWLGTLYWQMKPFYTLYTNFSLIDVDTKVY